MSKHQGRRINRRTAERLLRGAPVDASDTLVGLLAAAGAPPRDGELGGEPAAMAAFAAAAQRASVPRPRSRSLIKTMVVRLLTVKAAAGAAAIFTVGGVAAVAATGHLTPPSGGTSAVASTSSRPTAGSSSITITPTSASRVSSAEPQATPAPSLVGLCHAYTAGAGSDHGKAPDSPAFTALITAAGGKTKVDAYCAIVLKQDASASATATGSTTQTSDPGRSAAGQQASTDHPTGPPSTHPAKSPTTHPTKP